MLRRLWSRRHRKLPQDDPKNAPARAHGPVPVAGERAFRKPGKLTEVEEAGRWYFKRDILDRLERHFTVVRAMRAYDEGTYQMAVKVGAILAPAAYRNSLNGFDECDALIEETNRIAFACVAFRKEIRDSKERGIVYGPEMAIISKYKKAGTMFEPYNGEIYAFTLIYELDGYPYVCGQIPIAILPNGLMILREYSPVHQRLPKSKHDGMKRGGRHGDAVCNGAWRWSAHLWHMAKEVGAEIDVIMQDVLGLFQTTYALAYMAQADTRIAITKDHITTAFGIDLMRLPYFFSDRARVSNTRRKSIFHIVRTHTRNEKSVVHSHYRGERHFDWNGYDVRITVPGKHHVMLTDWTAPLVERDEIVGERGLSMAAVARLMSRELRA